MGSEVESRLQDLQADVRSLSDAQAKLSAQLQAAQDAQAKQTRKADDFEELLTAVKPAQQELGNKCDAALEQLDSLRMINEEVVLERTQLEAALQAERQAAEDARQSHEQSKKALEYAGPSKLSANDVLLSVAFADIAQPLEMMPWDGDVEAVVSNWLATVQRHSRLQPSLVRYLKHLEDSAETFPIRVEANLLDVHEEFAM